MSIDAMRNGLPETYFPESEDSESEEYYEVVPATHDADEIYPDALPEDAEDPVLPLDPLFAAIVLGLLAILGFGGLQPDARYTVLWGLLAAVAIATLLIDQIELEPPGRTEILLGLGYGGLIGLPILVVGAAQLKAVSLSIFPNLPASAVFQTVVFTMPLAETLFFRGAFQGTRGLLFTTVAASLWTMLLFFPSMNVVQYPLVALIFSIFFAFANFVYSYLRSRFGIYAAWSCQVAINLSLLFLCRFIS